VSGAGPGDLASRGRGARHSSPGSKSCGRSLPRWQCGAGQAVWSVRQRWAWLSCCCAHASTNLSRRPP